MHPEPSISVIVLVHREGASLRATLRSVLAAVEGAPDAEVILAPFDCDPLTREQVEWSRSLPVPTRECSESLTEAEAYNAGLETSEGRFVAVIPGGDVVTSDFLAAARSSLEGAGDDTVMHPGVVISFGRVSDVMVPVEGGPDYRDFLLRDQWSSVMMARKAVLERVPARESAPGLGPRSWVTHADLLCHGVRHEVVHGSTHFRRVTFDHAEAAASTLLLPQVDLHQLRRALPLRSAAGEAAAPERESEDAPRPPGRFTARINRMLRPGAPASHSDAPGEDGAQSSAPTPTWSTRLHAECARIEPALAWVVENASQLVVWAPQDDGYGRIVDDLAAAFDRRARVVVATPWVGHGGGDVVALNYLRAAAHAHGFSGAVSLWTTSPAEKTVTELLPEGIHWVKTPASFEALTPDWKQRVIAQTVALVAPTVLFSVNCFQLTDALNAFASAITAHTRVYPFFFGFDRRGDGIPSSPLTDQGIRQALPLLRGIISDNDRSRQLLSDVIGDTAPPVIVHRQPVAPPTGGWPAAVRARDEDLTEGAPIRLVWPHRLDHEKGPEVLPDLARALRRAGIPARIDVWGSAVFADDLTDLLAAFDGEGIDYRGPFTGGLSTLPLDEYHALLLTSHTEGLPISLIEALMVGLPILATNVGGVGEIVEHGRSGLLAEGPSDIEGLVEGVRALRESRSLRRDLITAGRAIADAEHSWDPFAERVSRLLRADS